MKNSNFNKTRLATTIAVLLGVYGANPAIAQEEASQADDSTEVIQVRGIRGSLMRAMDLKRESSGVVDAISAEEMGKFPDTNLAESLQRITGVSISRENGEGSQITVRGFGPDFNLITLNGRQMPGTGNSRSYRLENLSSEGVSTLEVFKTARAEHPSGGLGATVNIETTKPLKRPGERYSFMAKGIHDTSNETGDDVTPEVAGVYSNTFADDTLGLAFSFSHHQRDFQKQFARVQGWQANVGLPGSPDAERTIDPRPLDDNGDPIGNHFFPRDMNYGFEDLERERTNGQVTLQWAPTYDMILTVDYTATEAYTGMNSVGWGVWFDYGGNINAYELDENGTVVWADIGGNDGSFSANRETTKVEAESIGFNLDWQVTEDLHLEFDYHDSSNESDNGADEGLGGSGSLILGSDQLITKLYDFRSGDIPSAEVLWNNGTNVLAPGEMDSHFSQFIHSPGEATVEQFQLHGTWENNTFDFPLVNVKFGLASTENKMAGSNAWSGLIGGFLFNPSYTEIFPDGMFTRHSTSDFLDQFAGGGEDLTPNYYYTFSFDEVVARSAAFLTNDVLGGNDYFDTDPYHPMGTFAEGSVEEKTDSAYLQAQFDFEVGDYYVQLNAGARYEETEVTSSVFQDIPTEVWWLGGSEWLTQFLPGEGDFLMTTGEHDVFLPMMDLKVDVTDDLVARFSWGKTITRAPLGNLAGVRQLSGSPKIGSRNGSEGNTNLLPFESTNLDLSLEWYYDEGSYAAIGYFKKDVENFIGNQIVPVTIEGFHDIYQGPRWNQAVADLEAAGEQATNDNIFAQMVANGAVVNSGGFIEPLAEDPLIVWDITRPFNSPEEKSVDGFEVAVQHLFGETGFGLGVNATFVDGDVEFDINSLDQQPR